MARAAVLKCGAVVVSLLVIAAPTAMAAESAAVGVSVSIDTPSEGTVVDRRVTRVIDVSGAARFDTPVLSARTFYVRGACNGSGQPRLSVTRGNDGDACVTTASVTPVADVAPDLGMPTSMRYTTVDGVPFALDSDRRMTGELATMSFCCEPGTPGVGAGQTTVDITVTGRIRNEQNESIEHLLGQTSVTYTATPMETFYRNAWSIYLPQRYDRKDIWDVTLTLDVHGINVLHGFVVSDLTYVTLPSYDASFSKQVDIAVDDDWFRSDDVTLPLDGSTWTATIPTPSAGSHTIRARAVQAGEVSPIAERTITVIG